MKKIIGLFVAVFAVGWFTLADDLAYVSLDYCDTPENVLQYQLDPGIETGICYTLSNGTNHEVTIKLSFVDGTFTNDQRQNKACLSETDRDNFWRYVHDYNQFITLKAGESIKQDAKLMYPKDMDWLYYGCIVYSVVEKKEESWVGTSFSILMRKAKFIDVIVWDPLNAKERGIVLEKFTDEDGENISHNPRIRIYQDSSDGKYVMQIKVKNISRTQQDVFITWVVNNILGYKNTFEEGRKILKGESLLVTKKIDAMSVYNLKIKLAISNVPMTFGGMEPVVGYLKENTNIWIWNTVTLITLAGILIVAGIVFLIVKDLKRRGKVRVKIIHDWGSTKEKSVEKKIIKKKNK